jgi:hypothetical protein
MSDHFSRDYELEYESIEDRLIREFKEGDLVVQSSDMALMNISSLAQSGALAGTARGKVGLSSLSF